MVILRDKASEISYEQYAVVVTASLSGQEIAFDFPAKLTKFASDLKGHLSGWVEQLGLSMTDVLRAFLSRDVFNFLSKVGFNLSKALKAVNQALSVVKTGLVRTFERIEKEGWLQKLQQGTAKIDELLSHYPLLKKLTGPVVAGLLIYMWFSMSFTGSLSYDMDLSHIVDALAGSYSIQDLLATPNGLAQMTLLVTGVLTGGALSFPWLGASLANFILALLYTGAKKSNIKNLADKAKQAIQKKATVQASVPSTLNKIGKVLTTPIVDLVFGEEKQVCTDNQTHRRWARLGMPCPLCLAIIKTKANPLPRKGSRP